MNRRTPGGGAGPEEAITVDEAVSHDEPVPARASSDETGWVVRQLTEPERDALRACYAGRRGANLLYLPEVAAVALLVSVAGYFVAINIVGLPAGPIAMAVCAALGTLIAVLRDLKRLRRAFRPRRAHVPKRVWVWPVEVTRWRGKDRNGRPIYEARCYPDGHLKAVEVTREQWESFPEGPAQVEILPGGRRRIYRFRFPTQTLQVYPEVRCAAATDGEEDAAPAVPATPAAMLDRRYHRRKKRHRSGFGESLARVRRQDVIWFLVALVIGGGITIYTVRREVLVTPPPPVSSSP